MNSTRVNVESLQSSVYNVLANVGTVRPYLENVHAYSESSIRPYLDKVRPQPHYRLKKCQ